NSSPADIAKSQSFRKDDEGRDYSSAVITYWGHLSKRRSRLACGLRRKFGDRSLICPKLFPLETHSIKSLFEKCVSKGNNLGQISDLSPPAGPATPHTRPSG